MGRSGLWEEAGVRGGGKGKGTERSPCHHPLRPTASRRLWLPPRSTVGPSWGRRCSDGDCRQGRAGGAGQRPRPGPHALGG